MKLYETIVEVVNFKTYWKKDKDESVSVQNDSIHSLKTWEMKYTLQYNTEGEFQVMFNSILANYGLPHSISPNQNIENGTLVYHRLEGKTPKIYSPDELLSLPYSEKSFSLSHYFLILETKLEGKIISSEFLLFPYVRK